MTTQVFYGFGAYVASLHGEQLIKWWPADPKTLGWDQNKAIDADLSKTPGAVKSGRITMAQVEVDDHTSTLPQNGGPGLTQIGPRFPQGTYLGIIWLPQAFYDAMGANKPPRHQDSDGADYELTMYLHWNGNVPGKRYIGFRGKIVGQGAGNKHRVQIWRGGRGKVPGEQPQGTYEIDFANDTDVANNEISPGGTQDGAIYVDDSTARTLQLMSPKRPEAAGF